MILTIHSYSEGKTLLYIITISRVFFQILGSFNKYKYTKWAFKRNLDVIYPMLHTVSCIYAPLTINCGSYPSGRRARTPENPNQYTRWIERCRTRNRHRRHRAWVCVPFSIQNWNVCAWCLCVVWWPISFSAHTHTAEPTSHVHTGALLSMQCVRVYARILYSHAHQHTFL